jgi:hypothetical protein
MIIDLQTDKRAAFISAKLNPMIACAVDNLFNSIDDLKFFLKTQKNKNF